MTEFSVVLSIVSAVVLFWYGLEAFGQQIQAASGAALRKWLARLTSKRWLGLLTGAAAVTIIQSSGAVTALAAAFVEAGTMSFRASLGVVLGANIGTTSTGFLVSANLTDIGPFFIVLGAVLGAIPSRFKLAGRAAFYFGFVLFSLEVLGLALEPLADHELFGRLLGQASAPLTKVLAGMLVAAAVQSGSITTGLSILLVQQGLLAATAAIPIAVGANIGAAVLPLLATSTMRPDAKRVALANLGFNVFGVALFVPFLEPFSQLMLKLAGNPGMAVAWAQLIFSIAMSIAVLLALRLLEPHMKWFVAGPSPS
ncbi:MAG TPA: Na/Pi symporter [Steroidobacter sp.]|uniref:Na/Pi cotransporter family protein n=1 Tax=Steroidobacter sp. TaxID=1978227 RepID=UPI002EDA4B17